MLCLVIISSTEEQEFTCTKGKKDTPVKLETRLMFFDLLKLRQEIS